MTKHAIPRMKPFNPVGAIARIEAGRIAPQKRVR
jgi:hypothetical protein